MGEDTTKKNDGIARHPGGELRLGTIFWPQAIAFLFALFMLWSHSPLPYRLGLHGFWLSGDTAIGIGFSVLLALVYFSPGRRITDVPPRMPDILLAMVGMGAFVRLAIIHVQSRDDVSAFETLDIALAIVGMVLLLEAARRNVGAKIALPLAAAIAFLFLGSDLSEITGADDLSLAAIVHRLWISADGVMGLQMSIWIDLILPVVILGTLLDHHAPAPVITGLVMAPLRSALSDPSRPQPSTWFCGHIFSWCLGVSIFLQVSVIGTLDDLSDWAMLFLMISLLVLLLLTITVVLQRMVARSMYTRSLSERGPWSRILTVLTSVYLAGVVILCSLGLHSVIVVTSRVVHDSDLRVGNIWLPIILFAIIAAAISIVLRKRVDQDEPSVWHSMVPTVLILIAFVWFVSILRLSPALSAILGISSFFLYRVLEAMFHREVPDVARSLGNGLIDAIRITIPVTLVVAIAGLIICIYKMVGTI